MSPQPVVLSAASKSAPQTARVPTKVAITLYGRDYYIACDEGDEVKLQSIVEMVDERMTAVASGGGNVSEARLFMLTCLLLADELLELKTKGTDSRRAEEDLIVAAVDHLRKRVATIASCVSAA